MPPRAGPRRNATARPAQASSSEVFARISAALQATPIGSERTMYGPIRDLFREVFGHSAQAVTNEPPVEEGAPDVLVSAVHPGWQESRPGLPTIIVEAKDERNTVLNATERERVFSIKSKYASLATRWFVLVDPEAMVARPVRDGRLDTSGDLAFEWGDVRGVDHFVQVFAPLAASRLDYDDLLERFRHGDTSLIATIRIHELPGGLFERRLFFESLADVAKTLQHAIGIALAFQLGRIETLEAVVADLSATYPGVTVAVDPLRISAKPQGSEQTRAFARARVHAEKTLLQHPHLSRLAFRELPQLLERTGLKRDNPRVFAALTTETANLILARALLIRFFEDHGFFGAKRYICNGGVEALRLAMEYFDRGYTSLLREAYGEAGTVYGAAFNTSGFDWIFEDSGEVLSRAVEWSLFTLSRFDFTTVRGDVLSGVYERFMDAEQRKQYGEVYTPASIARFMLDRGQAAIGEPLIDPACGSGTFLIEAFELLAGEPARRGLATWTEAKQALAQLAGNDRNSFAAVLTQIQLLWHLLPFRADIEREGFPDLAIVEGADALTVSSLEPTPFDEIDEARYDLVVGNPPYVRPERQKELLNDESRAFYDEEISASGNLYALFLYRALQQWCRPGTETQRAGRVAFIVPISFADATENANLRELFRPDTGRWKLLEIVDMEAIGPLIFDVDVPVIIVIAERAPANSADEVLVRIADARTVKSGTLGGRVQFDLHAAPPRSIAYPLLFASDGRIRTRITPARAQILARLAALPTLSDVARPYYVRKDRKGRLTEASTDGSVLQRMGERWESRRMLTGGLAFRASRTAAVGAGTVDVYKGENIVSLAVIGEPAYPNTQVEAVDDPTLWRFPSVLPSVAYAVPQIEQLPNAVRFDPHAMAFTNTATIFIPESRVESFPFDLLLHSRVYRWAYAVGYRMGVLFRRRSHMYPENIKQLPWNDGLIDLADGIEALRPELIATYQLLNAREASIDALVAGLGLRSVRIVARDRPGAHFEWPDHFVGASHVALVTRADATVLPGDELVGQRRVRIAFGTELLDGVVVKGDEEFAELLRVAFDAKEGVTMNREAILDMPCPSNTAEAEELGVALAELKNRMPLGERDRLLDALDGLVGDGLGISRDDVTEIQRDLAEDPFLRALTVREPHSTTRLAGIRDNLARSDRYDRVT